MKKIIEFVSLAGAMIASAMLALNVSFSGWAYIPFLLSNIATIYLIKDSNVPRVIMYQSIFFIIINLIGIFRWLI